jgi:hypothetical protein
MAYDKIARQRERRAEQRAAKLALQARASTFQRLLASLVAMFTQPKAPNFDKEITKPKINLSSFKPFYQPRQTTHLPQLARVRLDNMTRQPGGIAGIIANTTS